MVSLILVQNCEFGQHFIHGFGRLRTSLAAWLERSSGVASTAAACRIRSDGVYVVLVVHAGEAAAWGQLITILRTASVLDGRSIEIIYIKTGMCR